MRPFADLNSAINHYVFEYTARERFEDTSLDIPGLS